MKIINKFILLFLIMILNINGYSGTVDNPGETSYRLIMCRPAAMQIKNIAVMREVGIIDINKMKLLCVYHHDGLTNYGESFAYVKKNKLNWVEFVEIYGAVKKNDLFKKNIWSSQFYTIFSESDGIIFTGGMDIPPGIYGEKNKLLTEATTPVRTMYEASFLFHIIGGSQNRRFEPFLEKKKNYPVLGICLGAQTMNVAAGGTLIQDIPSEVYKNKSVEEVLQQSGDKIHSSLYLKMMFPAHKNIISPAFHRVKLLNGSKLLKKINNGIDKFPHVLSSHHQAVKKVGKDLFVTARSMDGKIVEAIEHKKFNNVLGVQFHPEFYLLYDEIKFFTTDPEKGPYFTLKNFLLKNLHTFKFHKNLWKWFTDAVKR